MGGMDSEPGAGHSERLDAARNRRLLLGSAIELLAAGGVGALTMDGVARHAGVGKGTLFRRFGSRAGLLQELLNHYEQAFQEAVLFGPPPLGPGAAPRDRLLAFGAERIKSLRRTGELERAANTDPDSRYRHPSTRLVRQHLGMLLTGTGMVEDPELAAYQLAAFLDAGLLLHLHDHEGMDLNRLQAGWSRLVDSVAGAA